MESKKLNELIQKIGNYRIITLEQYMFEGPQFYAGKAHIIVEFPTPEIQLIDGVDNNLWVHCPKMNAGFGRSFSLHSKSPIYIF
jgi:hypothetical protein